MHVLIKSPILCIKTSLVLTTMVLKYLIISDNAIYQQRVIIGRQTLDICIGHRFKNHNNAMPSCNCNLDNKINLNGLNSIKSLGYINEEKSHKTVIFNFH